MATKTPGKTKAAPARPTKKPAAKPAAPKTPKKVVRTPGSAASAKKTDSSHVLNELRGLAKELKEAAKGLNKKAAQNPRAVSGILGSVERMTADAANKSLTEAEAAKLLVGATLDSLSKNWSRQDIEASLKLIGGHLTNIIVAQEFQDLAGQSLRKAMKALVGAIIVVEGGGPTEEKRLSQNEIDGLLNDLMP
jgi:chemotaxis regulatin CheY-phosphate phosphatase CheZ